MCGLLSVRRYANEPGSSPTHRDLLHLHLVSQRAKREQTHTKIKEGKQKRQQKAFSENVLSPSRLCCSVWKALSIATRRNNRVFGVIIYLVVVVTGPHLERNVIKSWCWTIKQRMKKKPVFLLPPNLDEWRIDLLFSGLCNVALIRQSKNCVYVNIEWLQGDPPQLVPLWLFWNFFLHLIHHAWLVHNYAVTRAL